MTLVVDWVAPDPAALGTRLADRLRLPRPDPDDERFALLLRGGVIRFAATGPGGRERIVNVAGVRGNSRPQGTPAGAAATAAGDLAGSARPPGGPSGATLLGVAWATVDLERGARELAARSGLSRASFRPSPEDGWLGAAARVAEVGGAGLVVLEPVTEGRVAAALARFGEGPVAVYLGLPGPASGDVRPGPLGVGSLVAGSPTWGPFAIVLALAVARAGRSGGAAAGTIGR